MKRLTFSLSAAFALLALSAFAADETSASRETTQNEKSASTLKLSKFVLPVFPDAVRQEGILQGAVTIAIGRDRDGGVNDVLVLQSSHPRFAESVSAAVRQWRFQAPADPTLAVATTIPVIRVMFTVKGVSVVQALTGTLANPEAMRKPEAPIQLPAATDLDAPLKPVSQPMPRMTAAQRSHMGDGVVTLKYFVDAEGNVRVPVVLEASVPELGEAASAAVAQWKFEPPTVAGRPTIAIDTQTFKFGLRSKI